MRSYRSARVSLLIMMLIGAASTSWSAEVTQSNDSTLAGTPSTPLLAFVPGESAAVWLTASCTGDIIATQVYWASQLGGAPSQLESSITLSNGGIHPTPGAVMTNQTGDPAIVSFPTFSDAVMNEDRFLDPPTNAKSLSVPVVAGQTFVASIEFINQSAGGGPFTPASTYDQDGCQAFRNAVDAIPGGWTDACAAGVTGDFVIRAVINCAAPVPAASAASHSLLVVVILGIGVLSAAAGRSIART